MSFWRLPEKIASTLFVRFDGTLPKFRTAPCPSTVRMGFPLRFKWFIVLFVISGLAIEPAFLWAASGIPTDEALGMASRVRATRKGVDRLGNLWSWNNRSGTLQAISPGGALIFSERLPEVAEVDFDPEWGVLMASRTPRRLEWQPIEGPKVVLDLPNPIYSVCWVGPQQVAVSPTHAKHAIELWDLVAKKRLGTFGEAAAIPQGNGFIVLRSTLLRFDFEHERLWALETFSGHLQTFEQWQSEPVISLELKNPRQAHSAEWTAKADNDLKTAGKRQENHVHHWLNLVLDPRGNAWLIEQCRPDQEQSVALEITPAGTVDRIDLPEAGCCSRDFTRWGHWLIFYEHPNIRSEACHLKWRYSE